MESADASISFISFDQIAPMSSVRVAVIDDVQYLSIRDFIMVMCDQNCVNACQTWRRFPKDRVNALSSVMYTDYKFKGRGQQKQDLIQVQGALKLLMWLPGKRANEFKSKAVGILNRFYTGDTTLLAEIRENSKANGPVNVTARAAISTHVADADAVVRQHNVYMREAISQTHDFLESVKAIKQGSHAFQY